MDELTRAELARRIAAHHAEREAHLNQAHYHAGAAEALTALLARADAPAPADAPPPEAADVL